MPRGRPRKVKPTEEVDAATAVAEANAESANPEPSAFENPIPPVAPAPIPVTVVKEAPQNPYIGKFPKEGDPVEIRKYHFTYNQQPGTNLEFTKGRTVLKANGLPGTVHEKYNLHDDTIVELPRDVALFLNGLVYFEQGARRPRCTCNEVE